MSEFFATPRKNSASVWRRGLGTTYTESDYVVWKLQFGQTVPGAGSGADEQANVNSSRSGAVPEPAALVLALVGGIMGLAIRRR
jgi:hypothetical protein